MPRQETLDNIMVFMLGVTLTGPRLTKLGSDGVPLPVQLVMYNSLSRCFYFSLVNRAVNRVARELLEPYPGAWDRCTHMELEDEAFKELCRLCETDPSWYVAVTTTRVGQVEFRAIDCAAPLTN